MGPGKPRIRVQSRPRACAARTRPFFLRSHLFHPGGAHVSFPPLHRPLAWTCLLGSLALGRCRYHTARPLMRHRGRPRSQAGRCPADPRPRRTVPHPRARSCASAADRAAREGRRDDHALHTSVLARGGGVPVVVFEEHFARLRVGQVTRRRDRVWRDRRFGSRTGEWLGDTPTPQAMDLRLKA